MIRTLHVLFPAMIFACALAGLPQCLGAAEIASGPSRPILVELFTSQGCSSCPPAERWLGTLADDPGLWKEFVPVAYHVDYWDKLGWKDPFASKANTERQYAYRHSGRIRSVYTPCFVVDGREWRGWFEGESLTGSSDKGPRLVASVEQGIATVTLEGGGRGQVAHIAILAADLQTQVKGGENAGRILPQEFVSLAQVSAAAEGGRWRLKLGGDWQVRKAARYGLAIWVTEADGLTIAQVAGGWVDLADLGR